MSGQLAAVLVLVAAAGLFLARSTWRTWLGPAGGCGSGCGKCATPADEPATRRIALPRV